MTIDEYAAWAATLGKRPLSPNAEMLSYLGLGLAGEAGEVADRLKKFLRDGSWDPEGLAEELGDVPGIELLGVLSSSFNNAIPWPTISSTIGHLEKRWDFVGIIVVGLITAAAFHAVAYGGPATAGPHPRAC